MVIRAKRRQVVMHALVGIILIIVGLLLHESVRHVAWHRGLTLKVEISKVLCWITLIHIRRLLYWLLRFRRHEVLLGSTTALLNRINECLVMIEVREYVVHEREALILW